MRAFVPKVVSANDLMEGDAVYLRADGTWSREHREAALAETAEEADRLLALGTQPSVVGAYLADARPGADGPEPVHFREVFRTRGPSNRHHGKQEDARVPDAPDPASPAPTGFDPAAAKPAPVPPAAAPPAASTKENRHV